MDEGRKKKGIEKKWFFKRIEIGIESLRIKSIEMRKRKDLRIVGKKVIIRLKLEENKMIGIRKIILMRRKKMKKKESKIEMEEKKVEKEKKLDWKLDKERNVGNKELEKINKRKEKVRVKSGKGIIGNIWFWRSKDWKKSGF